MILLLLWLLCNNKFVPATRNHGSGWGIRVLLAQRYPQHLTNSRYRICQCYCITNVSMCIHSDQSITLWNQSNKFHYIFNTAAMKIKRHFTLYRLLLIFKKLELKLPTYRVPSAGQRHHQDPWSWGPCELSDISKKWRYSYYLHKMPTSIQLLKVIIC
jgi:hypothetical protein